MKKYILITLLCVGFIGLTAYIYRNSSSQLVQTHQAALTFFFEAKQTDLMLEEEVLKARGFLVPSFDQVAEGETKLQQICRTGATMELYAHLDATFHGSIKEYCQKVEQKLMNIEHFKSKIAIFRNSLFYLHSLATDTGRFRQITRKEKSEIIRQLLRASISYSAVSTPESKLYLEDSIREAGEYKGPAKNEVATIRTHATTILTTKHSLDDLTTGITHSGSIEVLDRARDLYFQNYETTQASIAVFRKLMLAVCLLLVSFILYCIIQLVIITQKLADANAHLEKRVKERTRELEESQQTIIQQQQTLISTAKMSALGEMAGGVAHEINNPLSIISMRVEQLVDCLDDEVLDKEMFRSSLATVTRTTLRIAKIVSGLRFFARDGKREPFQTTAVQNLIDETLGFCQEKFRNHGVNVDAPEGLGTLLSIECRSVEISQVLLNLLNNSFDAIQDTAEPWIRLAALDQGEFVRITVTDSGLGIAREIQEKLMQPFFTTKEIGKGTGLGLSISRGIIEAHKGKFFIDNDCPNTCFTILLPKLQNATECEDSAPMDVA